MDTAVADEPPLTPRLLFRERKGLVSFSVHHGDAPKEWKPLPTIATGLIDFLVMSAERFRQHHQSAIGFLLLLNPSTLHWTCEIPKQVCGRFSPQFPPADQLGITPPDGYLLAGSLQAFAKDRHSLFQSTFTFPGLHLLCVAPDFSQTLTAFYVPDPDLHDFRQLNLDSVLIDDHRAIIEVLAERFNLIDA